MYLLLLIIYSVFVKHFVVHAATDDKFDPLLFTFLGLVRLVEQSRIPEIFVAKMI